MRRFAFPLVDVSPVTRGTSVAWMTSIAFTIVFLFYLGPGRHTPVVSANQLLLQASASEARSLTSDNHSVAVQKVRIQIGGRKITRIIYRDVALRRKAYRADVSAAEEQAIAQAFKCSSLSWDDPLSAIAYRQCGMGSRRRRILLLSYMVVSSNSTLQQALAPLLKRP